MALSNVQIASHMKRNSTCFYKVFAYDQFRPENCPFLPIAIVVNTEPLVVKMGHWVALYVDQKRRGTFFDSYGMQPWGKIASFFAKNATSTQFNKIAFQKDQTSCGHQAIFSWCKCRKVTIWAIFYKSTTNAPEKILTRWWWHTTKHIDRDRTGPVGRVTAFKNHVVWSTQPSIEWISQDFNTF